MDFNVIQEKWQLKKGLIVQNDIPIYSKFAITQNDGRKMLLAGMPEESYILDKKNFPKRKFLDMKWDTEKCWHTTWAYSYNTAL